MDLSAYPTNPKMLMFLHEIIMINLGHLKIGYALLFLFLTRMEGILRYCMII